MKRNIAVLLGVLVVASCLAVQAEVSSGTVAAGPLESFEPVPPSCETGAQAALPANFQTTWAWGYCYSDCSRCDTNLGWCADGSACTTIKLCRSQE
ncbi:MAG TPA: hypothetical protein VNW71_17000 [Thermoanaerobaculia bacterium]|nr:hypothetical protein [Thermoanaerobaculia bacterium]